MNGRERTPKHTCVRYFSSWLLIVTWALSSAIQAIVVVVMLLHFASPQKLRSLTVVDWLLSPLTVSAQSSFR